MVKARAISLSRRAVITRCVAAITVMKICPAAADGSPIAHGMLADNALARAFNDPTRDNLPNVIVDGPDGKQPISSLLQGRTVIMPVWAEWCMPCLRELPDFALLQREFGSSKFAIIPVLSAPKHKMTPQIIAQVFADANASVFQPIMETNFGGNLAYAMGRMGASFGLPCNLLIHPDGHVVGRETGLKSAADATAAGWQSAWGGKDGQELAAALANGFLS
jgi:thiol-disulfide isomerase/thioredoxin